MKKSYLIFGVFLLIFFLLSSISALYVDANENKIPVELLKNYTSVYPKPVYVNHTTSIKIRLYNAGINDTVATLKAISYNDCLKVFPYGDAPVYLAGKSYKDYTFQAMSNKTGDFIVTIELWYNNTKIDTETVSIEVNKPIKIIDIFSDLKSEEILLGVLFFITFFCILVAYWKAYLFEYFKNPSDSFLGIMIGYVILSVLVFNKAAKFLGYTYFDSFNISISFISLAFIFSIISIILIITKVKYYLLLSNIAFFMLALSFVIQFLVPKESINSLLYMLQLGASLLLGILIDILRHRNKSD